MIKIITKLTYSLILIGLIFPISLGAAGYNASFGQSLLLDGNGDYLEVGPKPGDLIAHWKFDNDLTDNENSNNLTYQGAGSASYSTGDDGQALSLGGSNYASISDSASFPSGDKMMIAASFKTSYNSDAQTIAAQWETVGDQRGWLLRIAANGEIQFLASNDGTFNTGTWFYRRSSVNLLNNNNWHRVAILWGAGTFDMFIDGVEDDSVIETYSDATTIYNSTGDITIGGRTDGAQPFIGLIDDVQIYNEGRLHVAEYLSGNTGSTARDLLGDLPSTLNFLDDTQGSISLWLYSDVDVADGGDHGAIFSLGGNDSPAFTTAGFGINFRRDDAYVPGQKIYLYQGIESPSWEDNWSLLNGEDTMLKEAWYHLVLTSDGATWKLYLNGSEVALENNTAWLGNHGDWFGDTTFIAGSEVFSIGSRLWRVWGGVSPHLTWWDGRIDDFRIYEDELTSSEVTSLYNGTNFTDSMVAYWDFNGDTDDGSGNGQNGFLRGDASVSTAFSTGNPVATFDNGFSGWYSGDVTINYNLIDNELNTINISQGASSGIEYSTDNSTWFDATDAGGDSDGYTGLTSSILPGTDHDFIWDSATDLADTEDSTVYIRIRPNDGTNNAEDWVVSDAFSLDNKAPTSVSAPTFGGITSSSIVVNKPASVTENGSGLYQWQVRRNTSTEIGFNGTGITEITDSSLLENTEYTYDVQFSDNSGNESDYGTSATKYTLVDTPTNLTSSSVSETSITLQVDDFPNDDQDSSGYYFENTTTSDNSGWIQTNTWENSGLTANTEYEFTVKYRNGEGVETSTIGLTKSTSEEAEEEPEITTGTSLVYVNEGCRDTKARNYNRFVRHVQTLCIYEETNNSLIDNILSEISGTFNRSIGPGAKGNDVRNLQIFLNKKGYMVSKNGPGSPGRETDFFGRLTKNALMNYQRENNIYPIDGYLGPITLKAILSDDINNIKPEKDKELTGEKFYFYNNLSSGAISQDVKELQKFLNQNGYTVATSGPGSSGRETTIFGNLTELAVKKLQEDNNIAKEGEVGFGVFGPKTREFVNSL